MIIVRDIRRGSELGARDLDAELNQRSCNPIYQRELWQRSSNPDQVRFRGDAYQPFQLSEF